MSVEPGCSLDTLLDFENINMAASWRPQQPRSRKPGVLIPHNRALKPVKGLDISFVPPVADDGLDLLSKLPHSVLITVLGEFLALPDVTHAITANKYVPRCRFPLLRCW